MIVVRINKSIFDYIKPVRIIILILSLSLNIYNFYHNAVITRKYRALQYLTSHFSESALMAFVASSNSSYNTTNIEIFDISKGEVIVEVKPRPSVREEAIKYLKGINGIYTKVNAFPDKGYIIRIPLSPPVAVQNQWLNSFNIKSVDGLFVLFPEDEKPYILVLDEASRPFFYTFDIPTNKLLEDLDFQIKTIS